MSSLQQCYGRCSSLVVKAQSTSCVIPDRTVMKSVNPHQYGAQETASVPRVHCVGQALSVDTLAVAWRLGLVCRHARCGMKAWPCLSTRRLWHEGLALSVDTLTVAWRLDLVCRHARCGMKAWPCLSTRSLWHEGLTLSVDTLAVAWRLDLVCRHARCGMKAWRRCSAGPSLRHRSGFSTASQWPSARSRCVVVDSPSSKDWFVLPYKPQPLCALATSRSIHFNSLWRGL